MLQFAVFPDDRVGKKTINKLEESCCEELTRRWQRRQRLPWGGVRTPGGGGERRSGESPPPSVPLCIHTVFNDNKVLWKDRVSSKYTAALQRGGSSLNLPGLMGSRSCQ